MRTAPGRGGTGASESGGPIEERSGDEHDARTAPSEGGTQSARESFEERNSPKPLPEGALDEPTEEEQHIEFVTRLRLRGLTDHQIAKACRMEFGFGKTRTQRLLEEVRRGFERRMPARGGGRPEQIARVRDEIRELREPRFETRYHVRYDAEGKRQTVVERVQLPVPPQLSRMEELLADLEGNRVPLNVNVNVTHNDAIVGVLMSLSDERKLELVERVRENRMLAQKVRTEVLSVTPNPPTGTRVPAAEGDGR